MKNKKYIITSMFAFALIGSSLVSASFNENDSLATEEVFIVQEDGSVVSVGHDWDEEPIDGFWDGEVAVTSAPTPLPTSTPTPLPTSTPSPLPTSTPSPLPTSTPSPLPTSGGALEDPAQTGNLVEMNQPEGDRVKYSSTVSFGEFFGLTRENVVSYLEANQAAFLGTPYAALAQEPVPGEQMQCTGFVWYVLDALLTQNREVLPCSEVVEGRAGQAPTWAEFFSLVESEGGEISYYEFPSKRKLLASGKARKGDIIWALVNDSKYENHVGFYWGKDGKEDLFWSSSAFYNSTTFAPEGDYSLYRKHINYGEDGINRISQIEGCAPDGEVAVWRLIPIDRIEKKKSLFESFIDLFVG